MNEQLHNPENLLLERARAIGDAHFELTADMARAEGQFDHSAGEVVMRCPAVFADRLSPYSFSQLSENIQDGFKNLASMASVIKPSTESENQRRPNETDAAYRYRTQVWQPIHGLQRALLEKSYSHDIEPVVRESVYLASSLFKQGLVEAVSQNDGPVIETLNYFQDKTTQAIRWSRRHR